MNITTDKVYNLQLTEKELRAIHKALGLCPMETVMALDNGDETRKSIYKMYEEVNEFIASLA